MYIGHTETVLTDVEILSIVTENICASFHYLVLQIAQAGLDTSIIVQEGVLLDKPLLRRYAMLPAAGVRPAVFVVLKCKVDVLDPTWLGTICSLAYCGVLTQYTGSSSAVSVGSSSEFQEAMNSGAEKIRRVVGVLASRGVTMIISSEC